MTPPATLGTMAPMSHDSSDREHTRRRIEDLEAQLADRDAALSSGEAAVAERDAEIARLRRQLFVNGPAEPRGRPPHGAPAARVVGLAVVAAGVALGVGFVAVRAPRARAVAVVAAPPVAPPPLLADPAEAVAGAEPGETSPEARRQAPQQGGVAEEVDRELDLGARLVSAGHLEEGIGILEEARRKQPSSAVANHLLGRALLEDGKRLPEAERYLQLAANLDPDRAEYQYDAGRVAGRLARPDQARAALDRAVKLAEAGGREPPGWLFQAHYLLGNACERLGDSDRALAHYRRFQELAPAGDARRSNPWLAAPGRGAPPR